MKTPSILLPALLLVSACRAAEAPLRAVTLDGNIAIGEFAMLGATQCSDSVAIGLAELAGAEHEHGATSINGRQLYISRGFDAFCLNPAQADRIQKTPLWYLGGDLHLNARSVRTRHGDLAPLARIFADDLRGYDLYLSEDGNDRNDGRSPATPKQTIWGCYLAATNDGERVAVLPGTYHTPSTYLNTNNVVKTTRAYWFLLPEHTLQFKAIAGNRHTFITGDGFKYIEHYNSSDPLTTTETNTSSLAFFNGMHVFDGFTVSKLAATVPSVDLSSGVSMTTAPIASAIIFRNCVLTDIDSAYNLNWSAFNTVRFEDTVITNCSFFAIQSSKPTTLFGGCEFANARVFIDDFAATNRWGNSKAMTFSSCEADNSLFSLWPFDPSVERTCYYGTNSQRNMMRTSTFIWDGFQSVTGRVNVANSTNCYFAVGTGIEPLTNGLNNAFAAAWTNTLLDADYVPASLDCPAVHSDGSPDSGWKQSNLGWQKTAKKLAERLSALESAKE